MRVGIREQRGGATPVTKQERAYLRRADAFVDPASLRVGMDHRGESGEQRGRHLRRQGCVGKAGGRGGCGRSLTSRNAVAWAWAWAWAWAAGGVCIYGGGGAGAEG